MTVAFRTIPVVDLMAGRAVHARRGRRDTYTDLVSPLCASPRPEDVVAGLLALHPFERMYVADLDAIMGRGHHADALERIRHRHPRLELWIDAGIGDDADYTAWRERSLGRLVLGTETLRDATLPDRCRQRGDRPVLSLDYRGDAPVGATCLFDDAALWPDDVIVMTLARVGSGEGPDLERLAAVRDRAGDRRVYAAGGVRDARDLRVLRAAGVAGALVATALHGGAVGPADLAP
jgi:phosphoribosylformimino-5-aminoimidazole carboxamide ribotide isomerase